MKIDIPAGKYIAAVSGGVDSMVLLYLLASRDDIQLIVAHFDHGIRSDSSIDKELVERVAADFGLPFEYAEGKLGPSTSEEKARDARYDFLRSIKTRHAADGIITAHHQDDLIETALMNLLRGTGRKGLTSLSSNDEIKRPLLSFNKNQIKNYAIKYDIVWREDETNTDTAFLRNYIRANIVTKMDDGQRKALVKLLENTGKTNNEIDNEIAKYLHSSDKILRIKTFNTMPFQVASEVMAGWLRHHNIRNFDKHTIQRLVIGAKMLEPGKKIDINGSRSLLVGKVNLEII